MDKQLALCLELNERMPPSEGVSTLDNLITLSRSEKMEDDLCQNIDVPLGVMLDPKANKKFITCNYNRDGDSFRSPYTNTYFPPIQSKFQPSHALRVFEMKANKAFDIYRKLYFQGGVSSVYCWDSLQDNVNFASCWACKNEVCKDGTTLCWSEIHVFEAKQRLAKWNFKMPAVIQSDKVSSQKAQQFSWNYSLTTTVIMHTQKQNPMLELSGRRQLQKQRNDVQVTKADVHEHHVAVMGRMAEELSSKLRASLARVYCPKTNEIMSYLHQNEQDKSKAYLEAIRKQMKEVFKSKSTTA